MKIKVCGLRDENNALALHAVGVRMMGFIFYERSSRYIDQEKRKSLFAAIPKDVKKVGVFVNESVEFVDDIVGQFGLDYVQLHGEESPEECERLQKQVKVIKAFRISEQFDFQQLAAYQNCDYLLFDAKGKEYGGNGIKYDWEILKGYDMDTPFLLSGGLGPNDVDTILAFEHSKLAGIDVNSGFEIEPGLKDVEKIKSFISKLTCSTQ